MRAKPAPVRLHERVEPPPPGGAGGPGG
jgi:hypothetical protein